MNAIEFPFGRGMLPMDLCVTAGQWLAAAVAVAVSVKAGGKDAERTLRYRWVLSLGFILLATMSTLRLIQYGDLPMSPPFAAGMLFICVGYIGLAVDRLRS